MDLQRKLAILADAAKYDASCASSGSDKRDSSRGRGIGSTEGMGICHSFAPDGRCISLLKVLLTNFCIYDCLYCVNRVSSNVPRARFTVEEVVRLTLDFYRRNYIEGLFLSSGIVRSPDHTMEQLVEVARQLRVTHDFRGYIHLKTIPDASEALLAQAGRYADRLSINVELPTEQGLQQLAPEKDGRAIRTSMARLRGHIDEAKEAAREQARPVAIVRRAEQGGAAARVSAGAAADTPAAAPTAAPAAAPSYHRASPAALAGGAGAAGGIAPASGTGAPAPRPARAARARPPRFAPGGQSTQMIVGADGADDRAILLSSARLYGSYQLRRVYYSAFSPIPDASKGLPLQPPPLLREHRLYQADWLMRFYGFDADEIVPPSPPPVAATRPPDAAGGAAAASPAAGMLALDIDPKLAWALAHRERFPVDLNRAPREMLLRVPGLGVKTVDTLIQARRARRLRCADLQRLRVSLGKVLPFVELADHHPRRALDAADLAASLRPDPQQGELFGGPGAPGAAAPALPSVTLPASTWAVPPSPAAASRLAA
ncbi:MAG: putative DNA modification/repair radical SAM protein [Pseudomonadota bacterium]